MELLGAAPQQALGGLSHQAFPGAIHQARALLLAES
jgi:hypothetical protein